MAAVLFFIAAIGVLSGAIGVVMLRNPFYSVLALVSHLIKDRSAWELAFAPVAKAAVEAALPAGMGNPALVGA